MARIQYRGLKTLLFFALLGLFDPHQVLANSCKSLLSPPLEWHVVGEHYKENYKAAIKRFGIKSDRNKSPGEEVSDFFDQIDERYSLALKDKSELKKLQSEWLKRALIKKIPISYINRQKKIARRLGRGADFYREFNKEHELERLKKKQQESFLGWFDYIMGPDVDRPPWLRYILLKDLLEIGTYNLGKNGLEQDILETIGLYPRLNSEAFATVSDSLRNYYEGRVDSIEEGVLEKIKKNERRSFAILYTQRLNELKKLSVQFDPKKTNGKWVKYEQGNEDHAKDLFDSLQDQNTGWCTAKACSTATSQIKDGDFYVYYSEGFNGEPTIPRIAILMEGKSIVKVRGRAKGQHLDLEMLETSILEDKLKEFGDKGKKFKQKSEDMKLLTELEVKVQRSEELSPEDLRFLYEIDRKIQGFGYGTDPRIDEIISQRNKNKDYALIFKVRESEVTSKKEDVLSGKAKVFVGTLELKPNDDLSRVRLEVITGSADFRALKSAKGLENLHYIGWYADFSRLTSAEGLENLSHIGGHAYFYDLKSAKGLEKLSHIGGGAYFGRLTSAKGLEKLSHIDGGAYFGRLTSAEGLENLSHIGGDANFGRLTSAEGLENLSHIGRHANFYDLKSAEGLENLSHIGRHAYFYDLKSAKGLGKLSRIGGDANFGRLTSAEGLENLSRIGEHANFESLTSAKGLGNLSHIGTTANFGRLTSAEGLENLNHIGRDAYFERLTSAEGLKNLSRIGRHANFESLTSAKGLENLSHIGWNANFRSLTSAEGLKNLSHIGGNAYFNNLKRAEVKDSLKNLHVKGFTFFKVGPFFIWVR